MKYLTESLFARPSFLEGVARIMDFSGSLNEYNTDDEPDEMALGYDWLAVYGTLSSVYEAERKRLIGR